MGYCGPRGLALDTFLAWQQTSQDAALEWAAHEARRCPSCGRHPDEGPRHVHVDVCPGCVALQRAQAGEEVRVRGAQLRMAPGTPGTCTRCVGDAALT